MRYSIFRPERSSIVPLLHCASVPLIIYPERDDGATAHLIEHQHLAAAQTRRENRHKVCKPRLSVFDLGPDGPSHADI